MTLKAELRAMAEEAAQHCLYYGEPDEQDVATIESALHAAVKRVLEQPISNAMLDAGRSSTAAPVDRNVCRLVYRAMTKQLLREIEE